jgi:hypothetical protein
MKGPGGSMMCPELHYNAVFMKRYGFEEIYSYDKDFDTVEGLKRIEP